MKGKEGLMFCENNKMSGFELLIGVVELGVLGALEESGTPLFENHLPYCHLQRWKNLLV